MDGVETGMVTVSAETVLFVPDPLVSKFCGCSSVNCTGVAHFTEMRPRCWRGLFLMEMWDETQRKWVIKNPHRADGGWLHPQGSPSSIR